MTSLLPWLVTTTALLAYAAVCWWHGESVSQFTVLNDFWGNAFAADHWQWNARRLWNGFFPPGYPFVLTVLPGRRMLTSAYNFNVVAGAMMIFTVWVFLYRWSSAFAGFVAMALVAFHPLVLTQVLTTGPDAAFVALAVLGALCLFNVAVSPSPNLRIALVAGVALGLAGWFRYHAFPWSGALLLAGLVAGGWSRWRLLSIAAIPITIAGLGLVALGVAAGDVWSLQRDQAFNTYTRLVQAPNWFHLPPASALPGTLGEAIARNPPAFWQNYLAFSAPHIWLLLPPFACLVVGRGPARRYGAYALLASALFIPVVNLGASPRGVACVIPLILVSAAWAIDAAVDRLRRLEIHVPAAAAAVVLLALFGWRYWKPEIGAYVEAVRFRHALSATLEANLRADRVRYAMQVFSTADLYFLGATGWEVSAYHPRIIGGWPTLDLPGYNQTYPAPSTRSLDEFLVDCQRFGITHLALGAASSLAMRELGQVFDGRASSQRLSEIAGFPGVRLFRIVS